MQLGDESGEVRPLQQILKDLGFFPADQETTGYFGPVTEEAVMDFQEAHGIERAGYVGPSTREALNQY